MKIYKLEVNEVAALPEHGVLGTYRSPRTLKKSEFYLSKDKAKEKQDEIYNGMSKLVGFIPSVEVIISEIEVIE